MTVRVKLRDGSVFKVASSEAATEAELKQLIERETARSLNGSAAPLAGVFIETEGYGLIDLGQVTRFWELK